MPAKLEAVEFQESPTNTQVKLAVTNIKLFINDIIADSLHERDRETSDPIVVGLFNLSSVAAGIEHAIEQADHMRVQQERAAIQGQFGRRPGPTIIS